MNIFKDTNDINEKSVAGFISLGIMISYAITDILFTCLGKVFIVNEYIFEAFMWVVLGSFGIAEVGKFFGKRKIKKDTEEEKEQ